MRKLALIIFPGVQATDVAGPLDVFAEANMFLAAGTGYEITVVGTERGPFRASNGMRLFPDLVLDEATGPYDTILVAGGATLPDEAVGPELIRWLHAAVLKARRHGSICTGAFVLGQAGLLDGKKVTTHWSAASALSERYPEATVEYDRIYVKDGPLVTSAGITAGIDLALSLVAEDHGALVSLAVAKRMVVFVQRQGGQSQFSPYLTETADATSPLAKVQNYVMDHLRDRCTVEDLADIAGMSIRNFARVFAQQAKVTPAEFVERARVDAARNLLEGTDLALKTVAFECGFGSIDRMRLVLLKHCGVTPSQYRASFRVVHPEADRAIFVH